MADSVSKAKGRFDVVHALGIRSIIPALTLRARKRIYSSTVRTFRENVSVLTKCYHGTYEPYIDGSFVISKTLCKGKKPPWSTFPSLNTAKTEGEVQEEVQALPRPLLVWSRKTRTNSPKNLLLVWKDIRLEHPTATLILPGGYLSKDRVLCDQPGVVTYDRTRPEHFAGMLQTADLVYSFGANKGVGNATIAAMKLGKPVMFLAENKADQLKHNINAYQTKNSKEALFTDTMYVLDHLQTITNKFAAVNVPGLTCITWGNCGRLLHTMYQEILGMIAPRSTVVLYKRITRDLPW